MVHVGKETFLHSRSEDEIFRDLATRNITISNSEIAYLAKKFIVYLAVAHQQSSPGIKEAINDRGGYILHLDGTCEGDSPHLISGLDEMSGIVLHNAKMPSEASATIVPFLKTIKKNYGDPVAVVRDMGKGIGNAVEEVFPNALDLICHFHFLRDIGKDLFAKEYDIIRKRLIKHKTAPKLRAHASALKKIIDGNPKLIDLFHAGIDGIPLPESAYEPAPVISTYNLILWAFEGKKQGKGFGFPFDRPLLTFVHRLTTLHCELKQLKKIMLRGQWRDNKPFFKLFRDLDDTLSDYALKSAIIQIESKIKVFDRLRDAMRITTDEHSLGLNDDGQNPDIKTIEKSVNNFRQWLLNEDCFSKNNDYPKMIGQIDKYWKKLFTDPITVETSKGKSIIQPQRTNNIIERFFRDIKRRHRRRTGTSSMSKKLKTMLAQTPLVKNLETPQYVQLILGDKATLEERFSEIHTKLVREELDKSYENMERIPPKIQKIIKIQNLPKIVTQLFRKLLTG